MSLQSLSFVGGKEVLIRTEWHNARGINVIMRQVVMAFDMIEINRVGNTFLLIQVFEIAEEIRIIHDTPDITFKVSVIDRIESD